MTGEKLLRKLSILCYVLGIIGIIIGIIAMTTTLGDTLFEGYMENIDTQELENINPKTIAGISFIISCMFTLLEGWLLGRAAKNGKKTIFLMVILILEIVSTVIEIIGAGFNSTINMDSLSNIIGLLINAFILNQVIKVRREALED